MSEQTTQRPVPRPIPRPSLRAEFSEPAEFAHLLKSTWHDRAAVFVGRRSDGLVQARRVWEGDRREADQVVVDELLRLIGAAQQLPVPLVLVGPTSTMLRLRQLRFEDPHVIFGVRNGRHYLEETMVLAENWRLQQMAAAQPRPAPAPLEVATDASVDRRRGSAGIACVDESGRQHTLRLRSRDVVYCELRAIRLALETFTGPVRILSDSQASINLIISTGYTCRQGRVRAVVEHIRSLMEGRDVTLQWVRGHNGHRLNETADRLAMAARRARELSTPDPVAAQIRCRIVEDLTTGAA